MDRYRIALTLLKLNSLGEIKFW